MLDLPEELLLAILSCMDVQSLARMCQTNRRIRRAACSAAIWRPLVLSLGRSAAEVDAARAACPPLNKGWRAVYRELSHRAATSVVWRSTKAAEAARRKYSDATAEVREESARFERFLGAHSRMLRAQQGGELELLRELRGLMTEAVSRQKEVEADYRRAEAELLRARRERDRFARPFQA